MELTFLLGRILFGGFFLLMGMMHFMQFGMLFHFTQSKKVPFPKAAVMGTGALFLAAGLGVLLGLYVEWAVAALVLNLAGISFLMHNFWAMRNPQEKMAEMEKFLKNMAFIGAALLLLSVPAPWPSLF